MWLIALYVPGMAPVNEYWIPPQWICLSIIFMEIFTIFLPCWEVLRNQNLRKETLDTIARWEKTKGSDSGSKSLNSSSSTIINSILSGWKSSKNSANSSLSDNVLSMSALEYVLQRNPGPLQEFSALRDFSGENIAFLNCVSEWKNTFPMAILNSDGQKGEDVKELVYERFGRALRIYADFISPNYAEFPINISSQDLRKLDSIFETPARILYGSKRESDVDPATPFEAPPGLDFLRPPSPSSCTDSQKAINVTVSGSSSNRAQYWGDISDDFDEKVFDDAEKSIKYLVLTNTWPKFIKDHRVSIDSGSTLEAGNRVQLKE